MNLKERNKQIKKAVVKAFPNDKVSVVGGRGTATGWVDIKVTMTPSHECTCNFVEKIATWSKDQYKYMVREERQPRTPNFYDNLNQYFCPDCHERIEKETVRLNNIVYNCGAEFSTYNSDDGYNTERAECLTNIEIIKSL